MEAEDIFLAKARPEDWKDLYQNVWSREETARYMLWQVTKGEQAARERMERTIAYQKEHDAWLIYQKSTGRAIGFAGIKEISPAVYEDTGIALGPEYVGRGYGKQVLRLLLEHCCRQGANTFYYSTRTDNLPSNRLALSMGFFLCRCEAAVDPRNGDAYERKVYLRFL